MGATVIHSPTAERIAANAEALAYLLRTMNKIPKAPLKALVADLLEQAERVQALEGGAQPLYRTRKPRRKQARAAA